jgi:cell wall-associated NlpC family hydrolase
MKRYPDWPERLAQFIESKRTVPFEWGENDCLMFAADAVVAITGEDPTAAHRGQYQTGEAVYERIREAGGLRHMLALPEKHRGLAQRGDIVLADVEGVETFGVVAGAGAWCGPGETGVVFRPMAEVILALEV